MLFALGLLLWGQGNLWNADYGVLAGQDLDLSAHAWRAPYELSAWAVVLLLALIFFRPVSRIAPFASLVFLVVQAAAVVLSDTGSAGAQRRALDRAAARYLPVLGGPERHPHRARRVPVGCVRRHLSTQDRAALDRQFSGFQYFADHAGSFPTTSFSMPAMLAGQEYRNQKPAPEFVREAFKQSSIFEKVVARRIRRRCHSRSSPSIRSSNGWDQRLRRTGRAHASGYASPMSAARTTVMCRRASCSSSRCFRHVPHAGKGVQRRAARRPSTG